MFESVKNISFFVRSNSISSFWSKNLENYVILLLWFTNKNKTISKKCQWTFFYTFKDKTLVKFS